jgi:acetoin utilization deacetylase AcuC-like enzyme
MRVTEDGFTAMAGRMTALAAECCTGKIVAVLEGGYDLQALARGARAVIEEFGRDAETGTSPQTSPRVAPLIDRACHFLSSYWTVG